MLLGTLWQTEAKIGLLIIDMARKKTKKHKQKPEHKKEYKSRMGEKKKRTFFKILMGDERERESPIKPNLAITLEDKI